MKKINTFILIFILSFLTKSYLAQTNVSGAISTNTTWTVANSPYIVVGNLLLGQSATLTIQPGVEVKFNDNFFFKVDGKLIAEGTIDNKISFLSNTPTGTWQGIFIRPTGGTTFDSNYGYVSGSKLINCDITRAERGLYVYNTGLLINQVNFSDNTKAIEIRSTNKIVINNCLFDSNDSGIYTLPQSDGTTDYVNPMRNTLIHSNNFTNNNYGIEAGSNQCYFLNFDIYENNFRSNTTAIAFGQDATIYTLFIHDNKIVDNINGITIPGIYGVPDEMFIMQEGLVTNDQNGVSGYYPDFAIQVYNNFVYGNTNNSIALNYVNVKTEIKNNIIVNNTNGVQVNGTDTKVVFKENFLTENNYGVKYGNSSNGYYPSTIDFLNNTLVDHTDPILIEIFGGEAYKFNNNNIFQTNTFLIKNYTTHQIDFTNNYCGLINDAVIYDVNDDPNFALGEVVYNPKLNSPDLTSPMSPPIEVFKKEAGSNVTLSWQANIESDLVGYKIYYNPIDEFSYANSVDVGNVTEYTLVGVNLADTFVITAYDNQIDATDDLFEGHESWYSNPAKDYFTLDLLSGNSYCDGQQIEVGVNTISQYPSDNHFIVELSDNTGSFANPVILADFSSQNSFTTQIAAPVNLIFGETYTVRVKSTNPEVYIGSELIVYYEIPTSTFTADATHLCGSASTILTYTGNTTNNAAYTWNFDSGNIISGSGQGAYTVNWNNTGVKNVTLSVTENGCVSTNSTQIISVYQVPIASFTLNKDHLCNTEDVTVSYTGNATSTAAYTWNFDSGNILSGSGQGAYDVNWNSLGTKTIDLTVTENGCTSQLYSNTIPVYETPTSTFTADATQLCGSASTILTYTGNATNNAAYTWNFDSGNIISGSGQGAYTINWNNSGLKNIELVVSENGCSSNNTALIIPVYFTNSDFSISSFVCQNLSTTIDFTGVASDSATFIWDFDTPASISGSGSGPYIVNWNTLGAKNVTLTINDNDCISFITDNTITHYPVPTTEIDAPEEICFNVSAIIDYIGSASNGASFNWSFDNGTVMSGSGSNPHEVNWVNEGSKIITLTVEENGCSADTTFNVVVKSQTQTIPICMVTVDDNNHNMLIWEEMVDNPYDSIAIYKESSEANVYNKIATQDATQLSSYIDQSSNPSQNSSKYKIAVIDTCGYETELSDYHKTMHLTMNAGMSGSWNLIWDSYEGFDYTTFIIYRGTSNGNLTVIAQQASTTFTYTDLTPPAGTVFYQIEAVKTIPCTASSGKSVDYTSTHSNLINSDSTNSVTENELDGLKVWPNPVNDMLYIYLELNNQNVAASLFASDGKQVVHQGISQDVSSIDLSSLKPGLYTLKITMGSETINKKIVKM